MDEPLVRVERAVAAAVRRYGLWKPGVRLVVAVSGGADSLCLVGALLALRAQGAASAPGEIVVAHLDHGLRGGRGTGRRRLGRRRFRCEQGLAGLLAPQWM